MLKSGKRFILIGYFKFTTTIMHQCDAFFDLLHHISALRALVDCERKCAELVL